MTELRSLFISHLQSSSFFPRAFRDGHSIPHDFPLSSGLMCVLTSSCCLTPLCALSVLGLQCSFLNNMWQDYTT